MVDSRLPEDQDIRKVLQVIMPDARESEPGNVYYDPRDKPEFQGLKPTVWQGNDAIMEALVADVKERLRDQEMPSDADQRPPAGKRKMAKILKNEAWNAYSSRVHAGLSIANKEDLAYQAAFIEYFAYITWKVKTSGAFHGMRTFVNDTVPDHGAIINECLDKMAGTLLSVRTPEEFLKYTTTICEHEAVDRLRRYYPDQYKDHISIGKAMDILNDQYPAECKKYKENPYDFACINALNKAITSLKEHYPDAFRDRAKVLEAVRERDGKPRYNRYLSEAAATEDEGDGYTFVDVIPDDAASRMNHVSIVGEKMRNMLIDVISDGRLPLPDGCVLLIAVAVAGMSSKEKDAFGTEIAENERETHNRIRFEYLRDLLTKPDGCAQLIHGTSDQPPPAIVDLGRRMQQETVKENFTSSPRTLSDRFRRAKPRWLKIDGVAAELTILKERFGGFDGSTEPFA